jgi:signal transduction histidine kinase
MEILEDKEKQWTIEDISSPDIAAQFVPNTEEAPGFGFTDSAYWVRFQVRNEASSDMDWMLLYDSAAFYVDYYLPAAEGEAYEAIHTGSALPFDTRDVPVEEFVFHLPIAPQESQTVYMRFASEGTLILALEVLSEDLFLKQATLQRAINGILYGVLFILAVYNLVLFFNLRDATYLYYVLFFSTMLIGMMAVDGSAARYLWPNQGPFAAVAARFFLVLSFNFGLLFTISFLQTKENVPLLNAIMVTLVILIFVFLGLQFIWFRETAVIHVSLLVVGGVSMLLAGLVVWRKGYRPARYFLIGWSVVLVGFIILLLTLVGVIPVNDVGETSIRIGLIALALVLSAGLAERINVYRQEKDTAVAKERNRLARDLHDSVTQSLYSASLLAEVLPEIRQRDPEEADDGLQELRHLTRGALAEMRTMLLELRPETVVKTPLGNLLEQLVEALTSRMEIEVQTDIQPVPVLPPAEHINIYRVAQEALNNVIKHSEASHLLVSLLPTPAFTKPSIIGWRGQLELRVQDDGIGFDDKKLPANSLGLGIMRERSVEIGAIVIVWEGEGVNGKGI